MHDPNLPDSRGVMSQISQETASSQASSTKLTRILVSTFAYNEHVKIEKTIQRIYDAQLESAIPNAQVEVIVSDDGSTDRYPAVLQSKYGFTLLRNEENRGIGFCIRRVIEYGLEKEFDILVIMAGNNKDEPQEIKELVRPILEGDVDFVQGSRYLPGGSYGSMPLYRRVATQFVHPLLVYAVTGTKLSDTTNGFRAIRLAAFRNSKMDLNQEWLDRYGMEYYLLYHFLTKGYRCGEVPVSKIYPPKQLGYTKIRPFQGWWDILKPLVYLALKIKK